MANKTKGRPWKKKWWQTFQPCPHCYDRARLSYLWTNGASKHCDRCGYREGPDDRREAHNSAFALIDPKRITSTAL